jgi:hypothetical protein
MLLLTLRFDMFPILQGRLAAWIAAPQGRLAMTIVGVAF